MYLVFTESDYEIYYVYIGNDLETAQQYYKCHIKDHRNTFLTEIKESNYRKTKHVCPYCQEDKKLLITRARDRIKGPLNIYHCDNCNSCFDHKGNKLP